MIKICQLLVLVLLLGCSGPTTVSSGNGGATGAGNPIVIGIAHYTDGTPVVDGVVKLFSQDSAVVVANDTVARTDSSGEFRFTLGTGGEYLLEVWDRQGDRAYAEHLSVKESELNLDTVSIVDLAIYTGTVTYEQTNNSDDSATIRIVETGRTETVRVGELFGITLPNNSYTIEVTPVDTSYRSVIFFSVPEESQWGTIVLEKKETPDDLFVQDSLLVRSILNSNLLQGVAVDDVSTADGTPKRITALTISDLPFFYLPDEIAQLDQLRNLTLSGTELTVLPDEISKCELLKTIDLSNNELITLPESVIALKEVYQINVSGNFLTYLPEEVRKWVSLYDPDWARTQRWFE